MLFSGGALVSSAPTEQTAHILPQNSQNSRKLLAEDILPRISQMLTEVSAVDILPQISQMLTDF